jgi:hypothetical protein
MDFILRAAAMPQGKSTIALLLTLTLLGQGCARLPFGGWQADNGVTGFAMPNPLPVPFYARELVMDEVSDEVEDYFRIIKEQRIRLTGNVLTEGYIDTEPKIGSSVLEPWRNDSSPGFELAHASLQTVRRWAKVRVIPTADKYLIDVKVYKELEDLDVPLHSSVSGRSTRHDTSLGFDRDELVDAVPNKGWIPLGRDEALEQTILTNLAARFERAAANGATCVR